MIAIIIFILILGVLVLIHEFGHFIVAKKSGILVEEFGFGFPPRLFSFKKGETTYSFNLLPIGGFVKVYGEEYKELQDQPVKDQALQSRAFVNKKPWQRALVIVAGVINNFILGWLLISFLFTQGVPAPINKVLIENVSKNSPAATAGLHRNDYITKVTKGTHVYEIKTTNDLITLSKKYAGQPITLSVLRNNQPITLTMTPRKVIPKGQGPLGISITSYGIKKYPWYKAPFYGLVEAANITKTIVVELTKTLVLLITFQKPQVDVTGPIGIAKYAGDAAKVGLNAVLELMAILSLNLAIVNILPFPALDGGRLVFVLYEWITKKRVNAKFERNLNIAGMIILLSFAALISINDVVKLLK